MLDKKIDRNTHVELLDIIRNGTKKTIIKKAESEFESRNLTLEQKTKIESDYLKYKNFKNERKDKPLTNEERLTFFLLPFFTTKRMGRDDHFSESEMERYEKYGFDKKRKEAQRFRTFEN